MSGAWRPSVARLGVLGMLLAPLLGGATPGWSAGRLGSTGLRAFELAKSADEGAAAALEEGERAVAALQALGAPEQAEALRPLREEAEQGREALVAYRRQAQAASTEALQLLAEATRVAARSTPDPIRQETLEQRGLLAAHEATVMATRARAEAERLRAVLAEARLALAGGGAAARTAGPPRGPAAPGPGSGSGEVAVPNLVGARLEGARRDLEAVGLRLGTVTGAREGFVVKQEPEAGARVPRQSAVGVSLSATAATTTDRSP